MRTQAKICCTSGGLENVPKCFFSPKMNSTLSLSCCLLKSQKILKVKIFQSAGPARVRIPSESNFDIFS